MDQVKIAVLGGTGLYKMEGVTMTRSVDMDTPFGKPSDSIKIAAHNDTEIAFLPRHGAGHRYLPSEIPVKANMWALKKLGVERIISVSAVGSLKEEIRPRNLVIPGQIIDRTKHRPNSFFGNGIVGHVGFADPFCTQLSELLYETAGSLGYRAHREETYVCMEGPLFSTRAESRLYRSWGGGVIGMTAIPEAKLAREAEICYSMIAVTTDYDCWKEEGDDVTIDMVIENLRASTRAAEEIIKEVIEQIPGQRNCPCAEAAKFAIMTDKHAIPSSLKQNLAVFYQKYWK